MSGELEGGRGRAVELLELRDSLDGLDEELLVRNIGLVVTPLLVTALAAPLLIVLFLNDVPFFVVYPSTVVIVFGAVLYGLTLERRRLREEREAIHDRIRQIEEATQFEPPPSRP